jgi:hypothetical protein
MDIAEQHNKKLDELYDKVGKDISDKVDKYNEKEEPDYKTTFPLFLRSNSDYEKSEIKIMFFGQETNGWYDYYGSGVSTKDITCRYDEFFTDKYCYRHYRSPFWRGIERLMNLLEEKNSGKKIGHLWNNIVKMGYRGRGKRFPKKFYNDIVKPHLNKVIVEEIKILKPDYIIFFTGPYYYFVLDDVFGTLERKPIKEFKELFEIIKKNKKVPSVKRTFRTYHPGYLQRMGKIVKDSYFNKIADEITKDIHKNRT